MVCFGEGYGHPRIPSGWYLRMTPGCFETASAAQSLLRKVKDRLTAGKLPPEGKMLRHGLSRSRRVS